MYLRVVYYNSCSEFKVTLLKYTKTEGKHAETRFNRLKVILTLGLPFVRSNVAMFFLVKWLLEHTLTYLV